MARPRGFEPFLVQHQQRLVQAIQGIDGRGVVVAAAGVAGPVAEHQVQVQKPALHGRLAGAQGIDGARAEADRRQARRAGQAFLRAAVDGVDVPAVDVEFDPAERGDRVHDGERAVAVGDLGECAGVRQGAGRGLGHHESQRLRLRVGFQSVLDTLRVDGARPRIVHHHGGGAAALDVFLHAPPEHAVAAHDHGVTGFDQVHEAGLHAHRARAGNRKGHFVVGLEGSPQQCLDVVHQVHEGGVKVADGRPRHGGQYARVHVGRAGAHQGAQRRLKARHRKDSSTGMRRIGRRAAIIDARRRARAMAVFRVGRECPECWRLTVYRRSTETCAPRFGTPS